MKAIALQACIAGLCLGFTASASAQTAMERIEPRLARAIEQHRVFLTCSSLDPQAFEIVRKSWEQMVAEARQYLAQRYTSLADLTAFDKRTSVETLLDENRPFRDVRAFCQAHPDWNKQFATLNFIYKIDDSPL